MGAATCRELRARFGSAAQAFDAAPELRGHDAALREADALLARAEACGARVLLPDDEDYPPSLHDLPDPPPWLFATGRLDVLHGPVVAVVGTRRASPYGVRVTRTLARELARAGVTVVSGLARGIDAAAHRAALEVDGGTAAVLGTGVDIAYPPAHRALHAEIARRGLLLSEELPGERANGGSFPKRNRIIAALARATIVVEAPLRSGALITAAHALDLQRAVAAVPGPIDVPASAGSNELLRDGAVVIATVDDALALAGATRPRAAVAEPDDPAERAVFAALAGGPLDLDALAAHSALPARVCLAAVTALELRGVVFGTITGEIRRA